MFVPIVGKTREPSPRKAVPCLFFRAKSGKIPKIRKNTLKFRFLKFLDALASLEPTQVGRSVGNSFKL